MSELFKKFEKLKALKNPTYVGFILALVCLLVALHYLSNSRQLNGQLNTLNSELLNRKSETDRLRSELDQVVQKSTELESQVTAATEKSAQDQAKIEKLEATNKRLADFTSVLESSKLKLISLITTDPESKAHGQFFWVPASKTAGVLISGLKPNNETSEYQLWMVQQGAVNLNLMSFTMDTPEAKIFKLTDLPIGDPKKLSSILVTREPKGGSSRPSGTRVLSGKL